MRTRLLVLGLLLMPVALWAADPTAREVLDRKQALDDGERRWVDRQALVTVTTPEGAGPHGREVMVYQRRSPGGEQRTVAFVRAPAELAGTAVLQITRSGAPTEQWLYDPARPPARQLGADDRDTPVAGTALTFGDLAVLDAMPAWTASEARIVLRGEEGIGGVPVYAIELWPAGADVTYRKLVLWIGRDDLVVREVHLFGAREVPQKRVRVTDIDHAGAVPWMERVEVDRPGGPVLAVVEVSKVVFNRRLDEALFTPDALARGGP